jgi:hypothetical protein
MTDKLQSANSISFSVKTAFDEPAKNGQPLFYMVETAGRSRHRRPRTGKDRPRAVDGSRRRGPRLGRCDCLVVFGISTGGVSLLQPSHGQSFSVNYVLFDDETTPPPTIMVKAALPLQQFRLRVRLVVGLQVGLGGL